MFAGVSKVTRWRQIWILLESDQRHNIRSGGEVGKFRRQEDKNKLRHIWRSVQRTQWNRKSLWCISWKQTWDGFHQQAGFFQNETTVQIRLRSICSFTFYRFIQFRVAMELEPVPVSQDEMQWTHPEQVASLPQGQQRETETCRNVGCQEKSIE